MKAVYVEDDVYDRIAELALQSGQSASVCLREPLGMAPRKPEPVLPSGNARAQGHELSYVLEEPLFKTRSTAVARMLRILRAAYELKKNDFPLLLSIRGRDRVYFAKSRAEIANSGRKTQPHEIRGTGYWVMTNSPTPQKREMLGDALTLLDFSKDAVKAAVAVLE